MTVLTDKTVLSDKKILLIVGGGIAAYKAPQLVRDLQRAGATVRVVLTQSAQEFVTPLALQAVSGNRVGTHTFDAGFEYEIGHIEMARWPDAVLVAPATANLIARMRQGMADDLATTVLLATTVPVVVCPAMNTQMLNHPAVRDNIAAIAAMPRHTTVTPDAGQLACHEVGSGRLPDPAVLIAALHAALTPASLAGLRFAISAGPTREHIDPVRFISNPSSGRMGVALVESAAARGATVTLVGGQLAVEPLGAHRRVQVTSATEMRDAMNRETEAGADVVIMAAAVADYCIANPAEHKTKKQAGGWTMTFERTPDIISAIARPADGGRRPRLVIGFAAETQDIVDNAQAKLERKKLDGIVANSVAGADGAFGNSRNRVTLLAPGRDPIAVGPADKSQIAESIMQWIEELLHAAAPSGKGVDPKEAS